MKNLLVYQPKYIIVQYANSISNFKIKFPKQHSCEYCLTKFGQRKDLLKHMRIYHNHEEYYECSRCSTKMPSKKTLNSHIRMCKVQFKCCVCDMTFNVKDSLIRHQRSRHTASEKEILPASEKLLTPLKYSCNN